MRGRFRPVMAKRLRELAAEIRTPISLGIGRQEEIAAELEAMAADLEPKPQDRPPKADKA